jgi:methionyl-tRNA formyltransferase
MQFFLIKPGIDDGDIFHFEDFDINEWDNCRTLYYKNSIVTKRALLEFLPKLLNGEVNFYQQKGEPTYYPKRTEEDGRIDWKKTVFEIYNFIRAITEPYPGAFCFCKGQKIKIWKATPFDTRIVYSNALEGEVVEKFKNGDFVVNLNSGLLLVDSYEGNVALGDILK